MINDKENQIRNKISDLLTKHGEYYFNYRKQEDRIDKLRAVAFTDELKVL